MTAPTEHNHRRIDVLTGRQVIVASWRGNRPINVFEPPAASSAYDPFQEGNEHDTPQERLALRRIGSRGNSAGWLLRVVPNRYPAIDELTPGSPRSRCQVTGEDVLTQLPQSFAQAAAVGVHDVVIECCDSRNRLSQLSHMEVTRVLYAWQQRLVLLLQMPAIRSVSIFRNEGFSAGASLPHCHSQILATDFLTPLLEARIQAACGHDSRVSSSLFEAWLHDEIAGGERILLETSDFVVLCPFASRSPWQVRICPRVAAVYDFHSLDSLHLAVIASLLLSTIQALERFAGLVAYNLNLVLPPADGACDFPWMLDVIPRPNRFAGFELMSDVDILTVAPETAAEQYRKSAEWTIHSIDQNGLCPDGFAWRSMPS